MCASHGAHKHKRKKGLKCEPSIRWGGPPGDEDSFAGVRGAGCAKRGKVQMSRAGGELHGYTCREKGRRYQKQQFGAEFLIVVGRYRVAFRSRGVYGREEEPKFCELLCHNHIASRLKIVVSVHPTFCEDEDFVVVDLCTGVVVRHGSGRCRER